MKKSILIILIGIFASCSITKEQNTYRKNYQIVKNTYPDAEILRHKRFSYIFEVYNTESKKFVIVNSDGSINVTKKVNIKN